jgi:hypothetical protein
VEFDLGRGTAGRDRGRGVPVCVSDASYSKSTTGPAGTKHVDIIHELRSDVLSTRGVLMLVGCSGSGGYQLPATGVVRVRFAGPVARLRPCGGVAG